MIHLPGHPWQGSASRCGKRGVALARDPAAVSCRMCRRCAQADAEADRLCERCSFILPAAARSCWRCGETAPPRDRA